MLAGHNPSLITQRQALDVSVVLLAEAYRTYGMDWFTAIHSAATVGIPDEEKPKVPELEQAPDNDQSMMALQAALSKTGMKFGV